MIPSDEPTSQGPAEPEQPAPQVDAAPESVPPPVAGEPDHPARQPEETDDVAIEKAMRQITRRSFIQAAVLATAGAGGFYWLTTRPEAGEIPWPLRRVLEANETLASAWFDEQRQAPAYAASDARTPRENGDIGVKGGFDPSQWQLQVQVGASDGSKAVSLAEIRALPRQEMISELMCIEGWSTVVQWAGARFADFATRFAGGVRKRYVHMTTPDGAYYVGLDLASAMHPQTLLAYEMNGKGLTLAHGAPLRLVIPVKYGVKNIKRIGTIRFTDERPADYWAERGYDWYAGL